MVKGPQFTDITDLSGELAKKIAKILIEKGETLVPKIETREERIAKLRKKLGGRQTPGGLRENPRTALWAAGADPAAETELALDFKRLRIHTRGTINQKRRQASR